MKQLNIIKRFIMLAFLACSMQSKGQGIVYHPLCQDAANGGVTVTGLSNYYLDFVGNRFTVVSPAAIAGESIITVSNDGSGTTSQWGGRWDTANITNIPVIMPQITDSYATSAITVDMTGKVALIYRGRGIAFTCKAYAAQLAHAKACIIIDNIPGSGPVGMANSTTCTNGLPGSPVVTIPVLMVGNDEGNAMANQLSLGDTPHVSIFNWSKGYANDLGFIYRGFANWHAGAIPYNQISVPNVFPYKAMDGAYIANFGTATQNNVNFKAVTTFTPVGGSVINLHTDSVNYASFPALDSIRAFFANEYDLTTGDVITGPGEVDVTYNVSAAGVVDQYLADNTVTYSYQITNNIFSKGRYDIANHKPITALYDDYSYSPEKNYTTGDLYYIAKGGYTADSLQFSLNSYNTGTPSSLNLAIPPSTTVDFFLMQWIDTTLTVTGGTIPKDSLIENGELNLVSHASITLNNNGSVADSSYHYWTVAFDSQVVLNAGWYYLAAQMPNNAANTFGIGSDGVNNAYIRTIGRYHMDNHYIENYCPFADTIITNSTAAAQSTYLLLPVRFGVAGNAAGNVTLNLDSVAFSEQKGLVPNIPLIMSNWPAAVKNVAATPAFDFNLFPNPASTSITASVGFKTAAKEVKYMVFSGLGGVISSVTHSNVMKEDYTYSTENLASGVYYMIVRADGKTISKKFTVIR